MIQFETANRRMPHLSIVATSRNDDHGGDMLVRMQHFVDGFIAQCRRHRLDAELILVEWNPPADRPPLEEALQWPNDFGPARVRIVTVPAEVHEKLPNSANIPLFQMIGKNVGIRRARGRFVLATNIDILFDDGLFCYMRDELQPRCIVRVDRYDVPSDLPQRVSFDRILADCAERFFHVSTRFGVFDVRLHRVLGIGISLEAIVLNAFCSIRILGARFRLSGGDASADRGVSALSYVRAAFRAPAMLALCLWRLAKFVARTVIRLPRAILWCLRKIWPPREMPRRAVALGRMLRSNIGRTLRRTYRGATEVGRRLKDYVSDQAPFKFLRGQSDSARRFRASRWLHTNGCGDFTLLSRDDWFRLRGYPEWPIFSWHLDSVFMYAANAHDIRHVALGTKYRIYHIDHGSGWSPAGAQSLFARLDAKGIPYLRDGDLHQIQVRFAEDPKSAVVNEESWGFANHKLPERDVLPSTGTFKQRVAGLATSRAEGV